MLESAFWKLVKSHIPKDCHCSRIENLAGTGIPDATACLNGREIWIELKVARGNRVSVSPSQVGWITRRLAAGAVNIWFLVRKSDSIHLIHGNFAHLLHSGANIHGISRRVYTKPFAWDELWKDLFNFIR